MRGYISDYKRPAADLYRVNTATGERTLSPKNQLIGASSLGISPDGNYFLFWKDNKFQAYNLDAGNHQDTWRLGARLVRRHGVRPSGPQTVVRRRGLHDRRQGPRRDAPLRSLSSSRSTDRRRPTSQRALARRTRSEFRYVQSRSRFDGCRRPRQVDSAAVVAVVAPRRRSTSRNRSRSRRMVSGRRKPASTSWRTAS